MSFNAPKSMSEQIAQHLAKQIILGQRVANERIQELKIVDELDVSRGSVREALLLMEKRHLVNIIPRRGAMVAELTPESVSNLFDIYKILITRLAVLVAQRWQDNELEAPIKQVQLLTSMAAQKDREEFMVQVFKLLNMSYPLARNNFLHDLLENLQPAVHRCYALAQRYKFNDGQSDLRFFTALMTGVSQREVELIPEAVEQYANHQLGLVLAALDAGNK